MKARMTMTVSETEELQSGIYSMTLAFPKNTHLTVNPGQFVGIYPNDQTALLPRPISVCRWDEKEDMIRLVYRIAGKGTREFSGAGWGDTFNVTGMLGNGYDLSEMAGKSVMILGGGIGIPPLLELACRLKEKPGTRVTAVLGYRDSNMFLREEFENASYRVYIATEDGSAGTKGNVLDAVREQGIAGNTDIIAACGPMPMLRAIKCFAGEHGIKAFISLEEHMACGVGACLGCVVKTKNVDEHSHVHNARICTEGPVFDAADVDI
jgi:dihydroorotate dehydrogenase electron transfer subunit